MLKRKEWIRKPYVWKRKPKKEGKGLFDNLKKEKKNLFPHLKKESKDEEWRRIQNEITPFFIKHNIYNYCELRLHCCSGTFGLAFAHSKKRDDWAKEGLEREIDARHVVRACQDCHDFIEHPKVDKSKGENGRDVMFNYVVECIERRDKRLKILPEEYPIGIDKAEFNV